MVCQTASASGWRPSRGHKPRPWTSVARCRGESAVPASRTLTLNGQGNTNAVFIFKTGSSLTTAGASSVVMINSASSCNVFWQVGSSATLGTTSSFLGNILALTSITLTTGANVIGRTLARNGAVTLDSNAVGATTCVIGPPAAPTLPEAFFVLLLLVLAGVGWFQLRSRTQTV